MEATAAAEGKSSWPKTPGGSIDWEVVFEAPETGLISVISQARSSRALRDSTITVIKMLYTRRDDPAEVARFVDELTRLVPDHAPDALFPRLLEAVVTILREIKIHRIEKAIEFEAHRREKSVEDRRQATGDPAPIPKPRIPESIHVDDEDDGNVRRPWIYGLTAFGVAACGVAIYIFAADPASTEKKEPALVLIDQMKAAADTTASSTHIFGGALTVGKLAGRKAVSAEGVPPDACGSAAWVFVNRGTVLINGFMPTRVSPNVLSKLCSDNADGATLTWLPK